MSNQNDWDNRIVAITDRLRAYLKAGIDKRFSGFFVDHDVEQVREIFVGNAPQDIEWLLQQVENLTYTITVLKARLKGDEDE